MSITNVITPKSDVALSMFPAFVEAVRSRLDAGRVTYGDSSFTMPVSQVGNEIAQELMDLCGWSFILWLRVESLQAELADAQEQLSAVREQAALMSPVSVSRPPYEE